ncbi:hypothetical protein CS537_02280 [Yersinia mollaretii]|nr:hypothetical protein CS537_02280 [Yersinia mollaretii]
MCWLRSNTRITYLCKLIGMLSLAAFLHPESYRRIFYSRQIAMTRSESVRTGGRVKRPRQGWRGSSHQGRLFLRREYGVFTIRLFSPLLAHCQQYQSRHLSYCCTAVNKKPPLEGFQWRLGL